MYSCYTSVSVIDGAIGIRLRDPDTKEPLYVTVDLTPRTWTREPTANSINSSMKTMDGKRLYEITHDNIKAYYGYCRYAENSGKLVYGEISPVYQFFAEAFKDDYEQPCGLPADDLRIVYLDIETDSANGFGTPENPTKAIVSITAAVWGHYYVWGMKPYTTTQDNVTYFECVNEKALLKSFVEWWSADYPDIVTGWYSDNYDIPYIINRIQRKLGEGAEHYLSPWGKATTKQGFDDKGQTVWRNNIVGVTLLDYIALVKKFNGQRASYRLADIAEEELGITKTNYEEHGTLAVLMEKDYQTFLDYNIQDVALVVKLEDKLKHISKCVTMAYDAKLNFSDPIAPVRTWEALSYYSLLQRGLAFPPQPEDVTDFDGGYVKEPKVGRHEWIVSFDVNSLYPSIIRQFNVSPDAHIPVAKLQKRAASSTLTDTEAMTLMEGMTLPIRKKESVISKDEEAVFAWAAKIATTAADAMSADVALKMFAEGNDVLPKALQVLGMTLTPNGQLFRVDMDSYLRELMASLYQRRKDNRSKSMAFITQAKEEKAKGLDASNTEKLAQQADLLQNAQKVLLNSAYGAMGNRHYRLASVALAEAVTVTGQVTIQLVAMRMNQFLNRLFGTTNADYVIASDTDSVYLTLAPAVKDFPTTDAAADELIRLCDGQLQDVLNATFDELQRTLNSGVSVMGMKREKISQVGIWTAKKRYLLLVTDDEAYGRLNPPKMKATGLEMIKPSTPKAARTILQDCLKQFLYNNKEEFDAGVMQGWNDFCAAEFKVVAYNTSANGLQKYSDAEGKAIKGAPMHVGGAILYNYLLKTHEWTNRFPLIKDGEKVRVFKLRAKNPFGVTAIAAPGNLPEEIAKMVRPWFDWDSQYERFILTPLNRIVQHGNWNASRIAQATLF